MIGIDFMKLASRLKEELPGSIAHEPLRALPIGNVKPKFEHKSPPKPGSVLILLYEENGNWYFPLTKRQDYLGTHSGQISLPGGKAEPGENAIDTALRETEEEIGIRGTHIEVIGTLSDFFVIPSNFMVTPVVAKLNSAPQFKPDPKEVNKILKGSINDLLTDDAIQIREIVVAKTFEMQAPHFWLDNEIVWGATAMMLNEFRMVLRDSVVN